MRWGKRAQGAMEFLMTYGWAMLIVIVAIGALVIYFGVDSNFLANEGCYMQPGFYCEDYRADEGSVMVRVVNSIGRNLAEISISHEDCTLGSDNPSLEDGSGVFLTMSGCSFGVAGDYMDEQLSLTYRFLDSSIDHLSDFKVGAILEGGNSQGIGGGGNSGGGNPGGPGTGYQSDNQTVLLLKFEEGQGVSVYDSSSYGNDGQFSASGVSWDTGYFGTGVVTDGVEGVVNIGDHDSINFGPTEKIPRAFTIEGWIKTTEFNVDGVMGKRTGGTGTKKGYSLAVSTGYLGLVVQYADGVEVNLVASDKLINDGQWHHFAFVYDERETNTIYAFIDGAMQSATTPLGSVSGFGNTVLFKVGKRTNYVAATFDEIRLSDFARY